MLLYLDLHLLLLQDHLTTLIEIDKEQVLVVIHLTIYYKMQTQASQKYLIYLLGNYDCEGSLGIRSDP